MTEAGMTEFDFWQTVAEWAIGTAAGVLLLAVVAIVRLTIKTRKEYKAFGAHTELLQQQGIDERFVWYEPRPNFGVGCNTTWAYTRFDTKKMGWWRWWWQVLKLSMLYKRSQRDPEGLDTQAAK